MVCIIREIQKKDNLEIEKIIRSCLREFGADHEGTAWSDPDLGRFQKSIVQKKINIGSQKMNMERL